MSGCELCPRRCGADRFGASPQPGWCTGRTDDVLVGLAVALAYYFDFAWLVFYIPSQVQVGSSGKMLAGVVGCPAGVNATTGKLGGFLAVGLAIDE